MNFPLAYFITFTCYGTWLHGNRSTAVDRFHHTPHSPFLSPAAERATKEKYNMTESEYLLTESSRQSVLDSIHETCHHFDWSLLAAHVRSNHVHLVLHAMDKPEVVMNKIKLFASRKLNASIEETTKRRKRWTRHGSTHYLWTNVEIEACIHYVVHEQGKPMAVYENITREIRGGW